MKVRYSRFSPLRRSRCSYFVHVIFAVISAVFLSDSLAQDHTNTPLSLQELVSLDLKDLMQVKIASKREESVWEAPSIVHVITREHIERFGARHLRDLIDRTVNAHVIGSNLFPHNRTSLRGVTQTHIDNNVLILLNGRPIRDALSGGYNFDIYNQLPMEVIERIEIIRGPGSVLYGTNAFSGAINLVTRHAGKELQSDVSVKYGSFSAKESVLQVGQNTEEYGFDLTASVLERGGDTFTGIQGEILPPNEYETGIRGYNIVSAGTVGGVEVNALVTDSRADNGGSVFFLPSQTVDIRRHLIDVGYETDIGRDWILNANTLYHGQDVDFTIAPDVTSANSHATYFSELSLQGPLSEQVRMLAGGSFEYLDGTIRIFPVNPNDKFSTHRTAAYSQLEYQPLDWLQITGGVQWNRPEEKPSGTFSPRLAVVMNPSQNYTAKLLYGHAFRSPFGIDLFVDSPTLQGNQDLAPEEMNTYEAQLAYHREGATVSLAVYYSEQSNIHTRVVRNEIPTFINSGEIDYHGVELELELELNEKISFIGNSSYQENETSSSADNTTWSPNWMTKFGLSADIAEAVTFSSFYSFFGRPTQTSEIIPDSRQLNPDASSYQLLTANMVFDVDEMLPERDLKGTIFRLYLDNILDEKVYFPQLNRPQVNSIPHHASFGVYGTLEFHF